MSKFEVVGEDVHEVEEMKESPHDPQVDAMTKIISSMLSLEVLSKKALVAFSNLFTLIGLLCVGALWYTLLGEPTALKIIGGGLFSAFVLIVEWIRRK